MRITIIALVLSLPFFIQAQVELAFFPYQNQDMMEDLGVTTEQIEAFAQLDKDISVERRALHDALLYREDYQVAIGQLEAKRNRQAQSILGETQIRNYQEHLEAVEAEADIRHNQRYRKVYQDAYGYLKITDEQAQILTDYELDYMNGKYEGQDYKTGKQAILKEILTEKQWKKYEKKDQEERIVPHQKHAAIRRPKQLPSHLEEKFKQQKALIESTYIPTRAALRAKLEQSIDAQDQQDIELLRERYEEVLASKGNTPPSFPSVWFELAELKQDNYIGSHYTIDKVVQFDRPTFEVAKRLAIKFDAAIDDLWAEMAALDLLIKTTFTVEDYPERNSFQTERVELNRNIGFLLVESQFASPDFAAATTVSIDSPLFPVPARQQQSLTFEQTKAGQTSIKLVDTQGRTIQQLLQQNLVVGKHQFDFDLQAVERGIFFYVVEMPNETKKIKSVKL